MAATVEPREVGGEQVTREESDAGVSHTRRVRRRAVDQDTWRLVPAPHKNPRSRPREKRKRQRCAYHSANVSSARPRCEIAFFSAASISAIVVPSYAKIGS